MIINHIIVVNLYDTWQSFRMEYQLILSILILAIRGGSCAIELVCPVYSTCLQC